MAGICVTSIRKSGGDCDHREITVDLDGQPIVIHDMGAAIDAQPWDAAAQELFVRLGIRRLRSLGVSLDALANRVTNGEEATNVKQYAILTKDVTKTNIGLAYVNVPVGANGERSLVDFTGCTEFRLVLHANLVGVGPFGVRLVRDSDSAVLYENASIALTGERELDTDWQPLPAAASGLTLVRFQAKSSVAADDPVFRRLILGVR